MTMFHNRRDLVIHFVGIGGIGMSGIAEVLLNLGYRVTGSDLKASDTTRRLESIGGRCAVGHAAANVGDADVVVISSAVRPQNPEVVEARRRGIPVIPRAEMLGELMRMKYGVAIAGSHGKTTTTSLVATVLRAAGLDPTAVIGGKLNSLGSNARLGQGEILVAEADESDGSFLKLSPTVAIVTNIDPEHLDHYGTLERLRDTFLDFINKVPFYGLAVLCFDHPEVRSLLPLVEKRHVTYGLNPLADYRAIGATFHGLTSRFTAVRRGRVLGEVTVAMPGAHNVLNALAVLAVADFLGVDFDTYREALRGFQGVGRRFTVRGEARGVMVVDDYGHHPAEIRATLAGARAGFCNAAITTIAGSAELAGVKGSAEIAEAAGEAMSPARRVVAAFQPHRYTRTRDLLDDFACAFDEADVVVVTDIYAAGEEPIEGVSAERMVAVMRERGHRGVEYVARRADVAAALAEKLRPGDILITLGAGDVWMVGEEVLAALRAVPATGGEAVG